MRTYGTSFLPPTAFQQCYLHPVRITNVLCCPTKQTSITLKDNVENTTCSPVDRITSQLCLCWHFTRTGLLSNMPVFCFAGRVSWRLCSCKYSYWHTFLSSLFFFSCIWNSNRTPVFSCFLLAGQVVRIFFFFCAPVGCPIFWSAC